MAKLRLIRQRIADLLFPPKCPFCGRLLADEEDGLCSPCMKECASHHPEPREGANFTLCFSALRYEGPVRQSLQRFKFLQQTSYAATYARLIAAYLPDYVWQETDLVAWAPVSRRRLRSRGFDQAELVARELAQLLDRPLIPAVAKTRHTRRQSSMPEDTMRRENTKNAYAVPKPDRVRGRTVLLVDDIITTGSTLEECSRVLREAGAKEVLCAAVASARH